ncbi:ribonuclease P protein component [Arcanobacterium haemolyticum]|nr:ribonuclease P protein component [Arcanobacterium haemolyticum]
MRNSADFARALRGARGAASRVVVSIETNNQADLHPVKVGFVVSKSVGNSVVRHRVYRQLRHLLRARLDRFTPGSLVVVRALPGAAHSSSEAIGADIDVALRKAFRKIERHNPSPTTDVTNEAH